MKIKNITIENIYQDAEALRDNLKNLEWFPEHSGEVLKEFQSLPDYLKSMLNSFNPAIEVDEENSGNFRKPFNTIRFEDFYENTIMVGYLALEPFEIEFMKYIGELPLKGSPESVYGIDFTVDELVGEYILTEKWETVEKVKVNTGELYFFSPDKFHKIEGSPITQVFYLNRKLMNTMEVEVTEAEVNESKLLN